MSDPKDNHEVDESVPPSVRGLPTEDSEPKDEWVVDPELDAPEPESIPEPDASATESPLDAPAPLDFVALPEEPVTSPEEPAVGASETPPPLDSPPPEEPEPVSEPEPETASEPAPTPEPVAAPEPALEPELFAPAPISVPEPEPVPMSSGTYTTQPPTPQSTEKVATIVAEHPEYLIAGALAAGFILAKVVKKLAVQGQ